jgi:histone H3/H4
VQKVLEELSAKHSGPDQASGARYKRQKISNDARSLILEYAKELSSAILEESCLLAKHRNSKELITADIKLIFGG